MQHPVYYVQLSTAGGERKVYSEMKFAQGVVKALNDAIVYRG